MSDLSCEKTLIKKLLLNNEVPQKTSIRKSLCERRKKRLVFPS